ncbi:MAG: indole-3-glycerol-phosphate synthase [Steroidobacteraceae bacterium]
MPDVPAEDFLASMARASRERVTRASALRSMSQLRELCARMPPPQALRLSSTGFDLIAELKLRSPAQGQLGKAADAGVISARVEAYANAGAACISVLTEPSRFDGSMRHLEMATRALAGRATVAMRKDFIVDPYQVYEARAAGASGVLLILRMTNDDETADLLASAVDLGMFALLEAFDADDLHLARRLIDRHSGGADNILVGVNCRDLTSLAVVQSRLFELAPLLPTGCARVAESGIDNPADAAAVREAGYQLALVGTALMQSQDPGEAASAMLRAARGG